MTVAKKSKYLLSFASIITGIVYFISGFTKAIDIKGFQQTIAEYGFEKFSSIAPLLIIFEVALATALILQLYTKRAALVSVVTLLIFTLLFTYAFLFRSVNDCGCFGSWGSDWSPVWFYVRNALLIGLSIIVYIFYPDNTEVKSYQIQVSFFTLLIAAYLTGFSQNSSAKIAQIESDDFTFEGLNIRDTPLSEFTTNNTDSVYMIFLFSYTCPHCTNSIENLKQYAASNYVQNIIAIGTGNEEDKANFYTSFELNCKHYDVDKQTMSKLSKKYPVAYFVKNNIIKKRWIGQLPAHQNLRKMNFLE